MATSNSSTIDTRTPAERAYDALKDGSAYTTASADQALATAPAFPASIPAQMDDGEYWEVELGAIDGCAVVGHYHEAELFSAELIWHGHRVRTDGDGYINLADEDNHADCVGDVDLTLWPWVAELATSGVGDQLIGLARQFRLAPRMPAPFAPPARGVVQVSRGGSDDGQVTWTDYTIGNILVSKSDQEDPHAPGGLSFILCRTSIDTVPITFNLLGSLICDLARLLADDRVRAAFGEPPMAAIRGER